MDIQRIISMNFYVCTKFAQIVNKVVSKTVVIIDKQYHAEFHVRCVRGYRFPFGLGYTCPNTWSSGMAGARPVEQVN